MDSNADVSYLGLRKWIGVIGLLLPAVVWTISRLDGLPASVYDTISAHYYTRARDLFVGAMALVGTLIFFYRSPHPWDNLAARVAGVAAVLIGLLPVEPPQGVRADPLSLAQGLHALPVTTFFGLGIYLVGVSFRRTSFRQATGPVPFERKTARELEEDHPRKRLRNRIYVWCAAVMAVGSLLLLAENLLMNEFAWLRGRRFLPESAVVMAFAFAWLVKGQTWAFVRDLAGAADPDGASPRSPQASTGRTRSGSSRG
ncbi:hypothetical protein [Deinococcus planocerae]|uniref:hypothetical protein n=1 Tax=Deinococcus planocerae TaxID=1737569 RepID=UPI000C7F04F7|nr:hypothetical protein [Deinococcus planocerae]